MKQAYLKIDDNKTFRSGFNPTSYQSFLKKLKMVAEKKTTKQQSKEIEKVRKKRWEELSAEETLNKEIALKEKFKNPTASRMARKKFQHAPRISRRKRK